MTICPRKLQVMCQSRFSAFGSKKYDMDRINPQVCQIISTARAIELRPLKLVRSLCRFKSGDMPSDAARQFTGSAAVGQGSVSLPFSTTEEHVLASAGTDEPTEQPASNSGGILVDVQCRSSTMDGTIGDFLPNSSNPPGRVWGSMCRPCGPMASARWIRGRGPCLLEGDRPMFSSRRKRRIAQAKKR